MSVNLRKLSLNGLRVYIKISSLNKSIQNDIYDFSFMLK